MSTPIDYLLHLADNAVVLGQRNAEWCGHGPILEEDMALANVSLDLIGQARLLYQRAAELMGGDATEDKLAYFRGPHEFRNYTLLELPHHGALVGYAAADRDYATTIVRNFLYSALMVHVWDGLQQSADPSLAAIAAKSLKETSYHLHHSRDWLVRMGDGTEESHARAQAAVNHLMPYTEEFWTTSPAEGAAVAAKVGDRRVGAASGLGCAGERRARRSHADPPELPRLRDRGQDRPALRAPELPARRDAGPGPRPPGRHLVRTKAMSSVVDKVWATLEPLTDPRSRW